MAAPEKPKVPKAKTVKVVCDTCGLDWKAHGPKPTLEACVRLLKAELAKRPANIWPIGYAGSSVTNIARAS